MATYILQHEGSLAREPGRRRPAALEPRWAHHLGIVSADPEQVERMESLHREMSRAWDQLVQGPDELFQRYLGCREDRVREAYCLFLETESCMTLLSVHDGVSIPLRVARVLAAIAAYVANGCEYVGTYHRIEEQLRAGWSEAGDFHSPSEDTDELTQSLLVWRPGVPANVGHNGKVRSLDAEHADDAARLAKAAVGELRARALGLRGGKDPTMPDLTRSYAAIGVARQRTVWGAWHDGRLAALALRYSGSPISSTLLCQRTEVLVHPDLDAWSADRLVYALLREVQRAAEPSAPLVPLLLDSPRVGAAVQAGFELTGQRYCHSLWQTGSGDGMDQRSDASATAGAPVDDWIQRQADAVYRHLARVERFAA